MRGDGDKITGGIGWALAAILLWGTLAAAVGDALEGLRAPTVVLWCLLFAAPTLVLYETAVRRRPLAQLFVAPPRVVALGLLGIFGYHTLLFEALERAPIVEANLLNYLWPLLIVVLSPVIARERVSPIGLVGAAIGFGGAALVVTQGKPPQIAAADALGFLLALLAAFAWSIFSLLLKRIGPAGEDRMTLFTVWSLGAAVIWAAVSGGLVVPGTRALAASAWVGVAPMALAFVCWERAMMRGRASVIGAFAYLDPLLSTLCVGWMLGKPITVATWAGMAAIIAGAAIAPVLASLRKISPAPGG